MHSYITYFEIAAFIASIAAWGVIKYNWYLRLYVLLLFIVVIVETYQTFFRERININNAWIYNVQVPMQYLVYFAVFYYAINNCAVKRIIIFSSGLFVAVTIITQIYFTRQGAFNSWSYSLGSVIAIICILIKFYEMLQKPEDFNFARVPFFYMLFAFLLFNVGTLPYFAMGNWLWFTAHDKNTVIILQNVMSVLNYLLYSTYTIAFLWMIKRGSC